MRKRCVLSGQVKKREVPSVACRSMKFLMDGRLGKEGPERGNRSKGTECEGLRVESGTAASPGTQKPGMHG